MEDKSSFSLKNSCLRIIQLVSELVFNTWNLFKKSYQLLRFYNLWNAQVQWDNSNQMKERCRLFQRKASGLQRKRNPYQYCIGVMWRWFSTKNYFSFYPKICSSHNSFMVDYIWKIYDGTAAGHKLSGKPLQLTSPVTALFLKRYKKQLHV